MLKIKRKYLVVIYWLFIFGLLIYTRFLNLSWGLPYPFHPDERNMAIAVQQLNCSILNLKECFNPHFFAYGQFSLYLGYLIVLFLKFLDGDLNTPISFQEAVISLRLISSIASSITFLIIIRILKISFIKERDEKSSLIKDLIICFPIIFSPFFIQFSHFGTTESLLMFFYILIIYFSLKLFKISKINKNQIFLKEIFLIGFINGLSIATKISSLIFILLPGLIILFVLIKKYNLKKNFFGFFINFIFFESFLLIISLLFGFVFSPHNLINWEDFIGALRYEGDIAFGRYIAFYTRQFFQSIPILFQLIKIFPYSLGFWINILAWLGFLFLNWRDRNINLLRISFLIYFLPNAFLFAKWTRFMAPVFPVLLIFAILFFLKIKIAKIFKIITLFLLILPGLAYLSIYQGPDVRFQASEWIFKNVPPNSYILSETANVVDIPITIINSKSQIPIYNYRVVSFDFYHLDENIFLEEELKNHLQKADYILIPSRRIFANYTCYFPDKKEYFWNNFVYKEERCAKLKNSYPILNEYYNKLFNGQLGFELIKTFESYPRLELSIFPVGLKELNFKLLKKFEDELAEETWSVFDHPVIRIYKKTQNSNLKIQK